MTWNWNSQQQLPSPTTKEKKVSCPSRSARAGIFLVLYNNLSSILATVISLSFIYYLTTKLSLRTYLI
ncbi:hypothetical protein HanOQP8_Chr04g0163231 [Helianthus annuus]|nr:hypothetical protein HanHA89_Chr04g0164851 [Helianthus annuus]KAJ0762607.1 hypothetical protein HanOQP8_Chr04g0163231 [Helianthus annuus]KAJ0932856.1 hypothetical protein HanPSC8_Chr04g0178471 [Helianthus annuus]